MRKKRRKVSLKVLDAKFERERLRRPVSTPEEDAKQSRDMEAVVRNIRRRERTGQ